MRFMCFSCVGCVGQSGFLNSLPSLRMYIATKRFLKSFNRQFAWILKYFYAVWRLRVSYSQKWIFRLVILYLDVLDICSWRRWSNTWKSEIVMDVLNKSESMFSNNGRVTSNHRADRVGWSMVCQFPQTESRTPDECMLSILSIRPVGLN